MLVKRRLECDTANHIANEDDESVADLGNKSVKIRHTSCSQQNEGERAWEKVSMVREREKTFLKEY